MVSMMSERRIEGASGRRGLRGAVSGAALGLLLLGVGHPAWADTGTRVSSWTYDATTGLMTGETVEPDQTQMRLDTAYTYDDFGNKIAVTISSPATGDAAITTRTTSTTYDNQGRFPVTVTNALSQSETRVYDPKFGELTSQTGPNSLTTAWSYDSFGRKTLEVRPDGTRTRWSYEWCDGYNGGTLTGCPALARYAIVTTPLASDGTTQIGPKTIQYMDALEREIRVETEGLDDQGAAARAIYVDTAYDSQGRVASKSRAYFAGDTVYATVYTYDVLGRVIRETMPDTAEVEVIYDGLRTTVINELVQWRIRVKNSQGQVVLAEDDDGFETTYAYDPFGNLSLVTDALGNETVFVYDQRGRKIQMSDPDKGVWQYEYDALGQLTRQTDAKGQVTEMTYDLLGRMVSKIARKADSSIDQQNSWVFDTAAYGIGKLAQATSRDGTGTLISQRDQGYDSLGRPTTTGLTHETESIRTYTTTYDSYSRPETVTYPSGLLVGYGYTALSELSTVTGTEPGGSPSLVWQTDGRDAARQLRQATYGNGVTTELAYEAERGRLTAITAEKSGTTLQSLTFAWDAIGNLTQRADLTTGGYTETFAYDYLNRLTSSQVAGKDAVTLTYDAGGNILSKSDVGTYSYNASGAASVRPHAVTGISGGPLGTKSYTYDSNGNMISRDGQSLVWTAFDMPLNISGATTTLSFTYDAEYQRIKQASLTEAKFYYSDPVSGARAEYKTASGSAQVQWIDYVMVGGQMVASINTQTDTGTGISTGFRRYFHVDHLGSIQTITDEAGALVERLAFDPWGKRRFADGTPDTANAITSSTDRGFTGHEHLEEVALVHMNGRVYDPVLGRFLSADPFVQDPYNSQAFNRYAYVGNNPLAFTDPSGYFSLGRIFRQIVAIVVAILLAPETGGLSLATLGQAVFAGAVAGVIATGNIKGAITGGISAGLFYGIGIGLADLKLEGGSLMAARGVAHGIAGGAMSVMEGGDFGSGFLAAGFAGFMGPAIKNLDRIAKIFTGAIVGGIGSKIGGGKFENGAITGAFTYLFGDLARRKPQRQTTSNGSVQVACGPACPALALPLLAGETVTAGAAVTTVVAERAGFFDWISDRVSEFVNVLRGDPLITVQHFTDASSMKKIVGGGNTLYAGSWVTTPDQVAGMNAPQVEQRLEIEPGRGAYTTIFQTNRSNLYTPENGPLTSGGAVQYRLRNPTGAGPWAPTP